MKEIKLRQTKSHSPEITTATKKKVKSTTTFAFLKLDNDLQRIPAEEIAFYKVKLSVSIDSPLCVFWLFSVIYGSFITQYITLGGHHILVNVPLKTSTYPLKVLDLSCLFYCFNTRKSSLTQHGWAAFSGYAKTRGGKEGEKENKHKQHFIHSCTAYIHLNKEKRELN